MLTMWTCASCCSNTVPQSQRWAVWFSCMCKMEPLQHEPPSSQHPLTSPRSYHVSSRSSWNLWSSGSTKKERGRERETEDSMSWKMTQTINTLIQKYGIGRDQFLHHKQIKSIIESTIYITNSTVHSPQLNEEIRKITNSKKWKPHEFRNIGVNETRNIFMIYLNPNHNPTQNLSHTCDNMHHPWPTKLL